MLLHALRESAHVLENNRAFAAPRLALIARTPALKERDHLLHTFEDVLTLHGEHWIRERSSTA